MFRLPNGVVARIGGPGRAATADREVRISRWLDESGMSVVQAVPTVHQPIVVDDRPVTWWKLLPDHRQATPAELAAVLRTLHGLDIPAELDLPSFDPFDGTAENIELTSWLELDDRAWLTRHVEQLRSKYAALSPADEPHVIHGDAWQGNVVVPKASPPVLLDLEKVSLGRREWDLVQIAVDYTDFARLTAADYQSFVHTYGGFDLTLSPAFRVFADIQELRWVCFALRKSLTNPQAGPEVEHRLSCLRGDVPRPWCWTAL